MNGIKLQYLNGLGLVAKTKRQIKPGTQYNLYFPRPENRDPIINKDGSVIDTVDYCEKIVRSTLNDTKKIAPKFKFATLEQTCSVLFKFIYDHIQYEEDKPGVEQLRRPARTWDDRKGDCDCMSIFASSILTNLGIPHSFRIVKMYGRSWFQHIYVIVPKKGATDMNNRNNYIVIDAVLDNFNQEAPKINYKKDFKMANLNGLSGIPVQYLNGYNDTLKFGEEFNGLEGFNGTEGELHNEFNRRMKTHLINTHNYIKRNPRRVSAFYQPEKLAGAYKELIGVWDSESAREGALDRLSAIEESFLQPHLQGLGDILGGPDDRLFALINADLNGLGSLGKSKKAAARKAAKAAKKAVKKRGHFTKIKQANKKVKALRKQVNKKAGAAIKKAGAAIKKAAKKIGKLAVKGATWPIIAGGLLAMKTNFGKLASRMYWGLFPKDEAMQHGILPDYWDASNRTYKFMLDIFTNKLMGAESTLRKAIISGRGAKVAKRGTHGLGNATELYTDGFTGLGVVGYDDAAAIITAFAAILTPTLAFANKNMKGKKATATSEPEGEESLTEDTSEEPTSQSQADHIEDNYNNEVVEAPIEQEPEADGTVSEEEPLEGVDGEREMDSLLGDLGKKIKSKPNTKVAKRVKKDKVAKKVAKKSKKATKKQSKINKISAKNPKKAARKQKRLDKKTKHIAEAEALKKMPKVKLIDKIKNGIAKIKAKKASGGKISAQENSLIRLTEQGVEMVADKIQNKSTEAIESEATEISNTTYKDSTGNEYESKEKYEAALSEKGISVKEDASKGGGVVKTSGEEDGGGSGDKKEGMSTMGKVGIAGAVLLVLYGISKSVKKKPSAAGLDGFTKTKHYKNVYELNKDAEKVKKMLKNKGEKLVHGYSISNRKKRVIKIK